MMLIENTISKLQEMKMATMAKAFREQLTDTNITKTVLAYAKAVLSNIKLLIERRIYNG